MMMTMMMLTVVIIMIVIVPHEIEGCFQHMLLSFTKESIIIDAFFTNADNCSIRQIVLRKGLKR